MPDPIEQTIAALEPISLDDLEREASLQRRVDTKFLVARDAIGALVERIAETYRVLEIDGARLFGYDSVYFDTPALDCFHDQVAGRRPRYKARTRYYRATEACVFEVKLKRADGETDKRSIGYDVERRNELDDDARGLVAAALESVNVGREPDELTASLSTSFDRVTLGSADPQERVTFDFDVCLTSPGGEWLRLSDARSIVECKSETGDGRFERVLTDAGREPISLSKYRLGVGRLVGEESDPHYAGEARAAFDHGWS